jgi:hypothetical protein
MTTARVEIRKMRVSDLKPADYNPRKITETAMSGLGESLKRFGMLSHIVWNQRTGNIVGGHQRIRHLIGDGIEETDVVVVDLGEQEEVALNIALNNPMIRGDFTEDVMAQLRQAEAGIGSGFNEIGLMDLFEHLKEQGFGKEKPGIFRTTCSRPGGWRADRDRMTRMTGRGWPLRVRSVGANSRQRTTR